MQLWATRNGECLGVLEGYAGAIKSVSLSYDGSYAVSSGDDRAVRVWDIQAGSCVRNLEGHPFSTLREPEQLHRVPTPFQNAL